ncbi:type II secretion system protein GspM [Eggerthella sp. YY7918]|uniref:type II secretion system protein GspM n=1 Tax=Eggerthella sp. (strain YY7918) TaxID=502558 RepID=UPI000217102D|nr:type II secretion system protein GspM [Eggerthella sp. YY7918]BAK43386.1 hypothetical protein EGYY_01240 [Eggerthella sp. YY7918]
MTRRSILNRSFSTREKVLMLILVGVVLVACYYFLVVKNVADTMAANQAQLEEIQLQTDTQTALAAARSRMENELAELGDKGNLPEVATYDNLRAELDELNALMASAKTYDVKFSEPTLDGQLVRRPVSVAFTTADYATALNMVRALENGSFRCEITDFSMAGKMLADGSVESVSSTINVTYLETTNGASNLTGLTEAEN